jgi:hypothetical protein
LLSKAQATAYWSYELLTECAGYTEIKGSDLGISTTFENSIFHTVEARTSNEPSFFFLETRAGIVYFCSTHKVLCVLHNRLPEGIPQHPLAECQSLET